MNKIIKYVVVWINIIGLSALSCFPVVGFSLDVLQFRAPYSLGERLHDGLVEVEDKVQSSHVGDFQVNFDECHTLLQELCNQCELLIDTSNIHTVQRNDRDFLQNMINRIDQMIQALEKQRSYSDQEQSP